MKFFIILALAFVPGLAHSNDFGLILGGVVGGIIGNQAGDGNAAATIAGAVIGSQLGSSASPYANSYGYPQVRIPNYPPRYNTYYAPPPPPPVIYSAPVQCYVTLWDAYYTRYEHRLVPCR